MTKDEAIEVLDKMKYPQKVNKNGFIISNVNIENEALDMAIQALSQEPCEQKSGKWIGYSDEGYDEEAIEKLELMRQKVDEETYRALILAIKALEQKPKTGHWIYDETLENWRCSKCNETPKTMGYVGTADFMAEHFKFCNHCGARMRGAE